MRRVQRGDESRVELSDYKPNLHNNMGQYFKLVNEDKREIVNTFTAHDFTVDGSDGVSKFYEWLYNNHARLLVWLLRRGGEDVENRPSFRTLGRWAGDRVSLKALPESYRAVQGHHALAIQRVQPGVWHPRLSGLKRREEAEHQFSGAWFSPSLVITSFIHCTMNTITIMHLADLYDFMKSTRMQPTYLSLVDIAGVIRDIFDDGERERLAELLMQE